jgi:photosystem II stability/assembly factor-like uncharacterized protein
MLRHWNPRIAGSACGVALIALGSTGPASAGTNAFTSIGPDGGSVRRVLLHPTMPSIAFALTSGGFYRSTDAGLNWQIVRTNAQFPPEDLAVDPRDPNRVLLAVVGQSPLVSTDAGATFASVGNFPPVPGLRHVEFSADGTVAYGAIGIRVVRSTDGGRHWSERTPVPSVSASELQFLRVDPLDPAVVYVFDLNAGGFRSTNGGGSWQPLALPANSNDMAITSTTPQRIWVASFNTGLHLSTDGGASFPSVFPGPPGSFAAVTTIAIDPQNQSVVYVSLNQAGVFRTADGNGWANVTAGTRIGLINSISVNPLDATQLMLGGATGVTVGTPNTMGIGGTWEGRNHGIFAASGGDMSFASGSGRIYVSTFDVGVHFLADGAAMAPIDNEALQLTQSSSGRSTTSGLLAQSRGTDRLFVGIGEGYARSDDGGGTWQPGTTGTGLYTDAVAHFADSPGNPDLILATVQSGLRRSIDGGDTWTSANTGLPAQAHATAVVFSSAAPNTAYAGIESFDGVNCCTQHGVYKSTDGGASWSPANTGFAAAEIRAIAVDPTDAQIVYAAAGASGLLKSSNAGAAWSRLDWPNAPGLTLSVAIDPELPSIVYVAGLNTLARSVDGGATWQALTSTVTRDGLPVNALLADPRRGATLLASTHSNGFAEITIAPNLVLETGGSFVNPVAPGAQETYRYRLRNAGPFHATGARAVVTLPADATGISATTTNGACVVQGTTVTCTAPTLVATAMADIEVRSTHPAVGTIEVLASASGDQPDPEAANNAMRYSVTVAVPPPTPPPPPPTPPSSGGGGGGGTTSLLWVLTLAVLRIARSYAKPRRFSTS